MIQVEMSIQQAREIAKNIYTDIDTYVEQHRSEFEEFLKLEGYSEKETSTAA